MFFKDGFEIYFFEQNDGFELTIRNPDTLERETILEVRSDDIPTLSPHYIGVVMYVMENAEEMVLRKT
jgi:hypothetical protein